LHVGTGRRSDKRAGGGAQADDTRGKHVASAGRIGGGVTVRGCRQTIGFAGDRAIALGGSITGRVAQRGGRRGAGGGRR
jgi:hypothetical protein